MVVLGIDYGDSRIGISVSDALGLLAFPVETHRSESMRKDIDYLAGAAAAKGAERIVLGLPLNMDGSEGERASKTRALGRNLEKVSGIPVEYADERLTTVEAEDMLIGRGMRRDRRKEVIDQASAVLILQGWLDARRK